MAKVVEDKLTFVTSDEEFDTWSEFLCGLVLRCATVPIEGYVKRALAGVEPQARESVSAIETKDRRTTLRTAAVKAAGYTVPILAAPLLHLYAYRAVSSVFDSIGL